MTDLESMVAETSLPIGCRDQIWAGLGNQVCPELATQPTQPYQALAHQLQIHQSQATQPMRPYKALLHQIMIHQSQATQPMGPYKAPACCLPQQLTLTRPQKCQTMQLMQHLAQGQEDKCTLYLTQTSQERETKPPLRLPP